MGAKIPAHVREQQINDLPNITFVRWDGGYKNNTSKAICRCDVDGFEWSASADHLINGRKGCPYCAGNAPRSAEERIKQINYLQNISFVRWADGYSGVHSKATVQCAIDGGEWTASVNSLINKGTRCPRCLISKRCSSEEETIAQINEKPNITFVKWDGVYEGVKSKAVCRCGVDGYEWATTVAVLIHRGSGCPQCSGRRRWTAEDRIEQINARPNISFVRWHGGFRGNRSKAVLRCAVDGLEWVTGLRSFINSGSGCPQCAEYGYCSGKPGTLYILRSECGTMVKIGISNNHEQRHGQLKRATPFDWHCIELLHSDDGSLIAEWEKELHSWTEQAEFSEPFDGYTEWRKWDDRLPRWIKRYRARLERYNKAP